jgi:hypothetical protein
VGDMKPDRIFSNRIFLLYTSYHTGIQTVKHCDGGLLHHIMVVLLAPKSSFSSQDFPPFTQNKKDLIIIPFWVS